MDVEILAMKNQYIIRKERKKKVFDLVKSALVAISVPFGCIAGIFGYSQKEGDKGSY